MCNLIPCPEVTILGVKSVIPEHEILSTVIEAIAQNGDCQYLPLLLDSLNHFDFDVRSSAAIALSKIRCDNETVTSALKDAISQLINNLEDADSYLRYRAAQYLGKILSETALSELSNKLQNQDFIVMNQGKNFTQAVEALESVQQGLKYYSNMKLSNNYALLIGIGECEDSQLSLPVTVKDVQALKTLLTNQNSCGYINNEQHLRLLHDATATSKNILDSLNWLKQQAENDPEATVLIFYSGHGFLDADGDYYLIPHETDRVDIPNTALPANKFNAALQQIPAKRLLVIIDSCHAQGMASSKLPLPQGFTQTSLPATSINELTQGTGKVVFTSCRENQLSWVLPDGEMSVYTYHLLDALQGAANQQGDTVVRVSHLMNYLGQTVPQSAREFYKAEQTPFFDFETEDFPVALLCGGKGLIRAINPVLPQAKITLDPVTIQELKTIFQSVMRNENSRESFLVSALGDELPILQQMTFSGNYQAFSTHLVMQLKDYGRLPSGKQALWELLDYTRLQVGIDIQERINNLEPRINI